MPFCTTLPRAKHMRTNVGPHFVGPSLRCDWSIRKGAELNGSVYCQRQVSSLGVSQHMHEITNQWKFELSWSSKLRNNNEIKNTLVTWSCVLSVAWFRDLKIWIRGLEIKIVENYFFLENYITSGGAVSHNVLYYQPHYSLPSKVLCINILSNYQ